MTGFHSIRYFWGFPTVVNNQHESLFRSYQVLQEVKLLLEAGTPIAVVLRFIEDAENPPDGIAQEAAS